MRWQLVPQWRWAVGSSKQLTKVWTRYQIGVLPSTKTVAGVTVHDRAHGGRVRDRRGRLPARALPLAVQRRRGHAALTAPVGVARSAQHERPRAQRARRARSRAGRDIRADALAGSRRAGELHAGRRCELRTALLRATSTRPAGIRARPGSSRARRTPFVRSSGPVEAEAVRHHDQQPVLVDEGNSAPRKRAYGRGFCQRP